MISKGTRLRLSQYLENLQIKGRMTFAKTEALNALNTTEESFMRTSQRLIKKGHLIKPVTGFYVIVGIQHRTMGSPPPLLYIHELMAFLERPYYVGLLSAAAHYGATHQAVQELQVITNSPLKIIRIGKTRVRFLTNKLAPKIPTQNVRTVQGDVKISTPEATAFDLVRYYRRVGGLSHVATVFLEMHKRIDKRKLLTIVKIYNEISLAQRLGYLLETYGSAKIVDTLHEWLKRQEHVLVALSPGQKEEIGRSDKWSVIINTKIEPDDL